MKHYSVLLAEDEVFSRAMHTTLLEEHRCKVETVEYGRKFLEKYQANHYDLILMSTHFEKAGMEIVRAIRAWEYIIKKSLTPIVGIFPEGVTVKKIPYQRYYRAGMNAVFRAPLTSQKLKKILDVYVLPEFSEEM